MTRPSLNRSRAASGWQIAVLLVCAFAGLLLARPTPGAEPVRVEALYGKCNQTLTGDGIWWLSQYPHTTDTRTSCWQLGVSRIETQYRTWDIGWRLAYVDFGTLRWDAIWTMVEEEGLGKPPIDGKDCDTSKTRSGCLNKADMKQSTRGVSLGAIAEHKWGSVTVGGDLGLYFYSSKFSYSNELYPDPVRQWSWDYEGPGITPYVGLTLRYGYLLAQARYYDVIKAHKSGCGECSGVTNGPATQYSIGLSIPF